MEQWTDITLEENAAVAAVVWGVDDDSIAADSSEEVEADASSSSTTTSARGPQLWTPPDISRDLPVPNANGTRDSFNEQWDNGDKTPTTRWSPNSIQSNAGQGATTPAQTMAEEWWTQNRVPEQTPKTRPRVVASKLATYARAVPTSIKHEPYERTDDDTILLATPNELTEDEFNYSADVSIQNCTTFAKTNHCLCLSGGGGT